MRRVEMWNVQLFFDNVFDLFHPLALIPIQKFNLKIAVNARDHVLQLRAFGKKTLQQVFLQFR